MPVSGLVVTLDADPNRARGAVTQILNHSAFDVGERCGHRLPVVLETPDRQDDKQCWQWLNDLSGVVHVDAAFIHFDEAPSGCAKQPAEPATALTIRET